MQVFVIVGNPADADSAPARDLGQGRAGCRGRQPYAPFCRSVRIPSGPSTFLGGGLHEADGLVCPRTGRPRVANRNSRSRSATSTVAAMALGENLLDRREPLRLPARARLTRARQTRIASSTAGSPRAGLQHGLISRSHRCQTSIPRSAPGLNRPTHRVDASDLGGDCRGKFSCEQVLVCQ